jgi:hypothetical protein
VVKNERIVELFLLGLTYNEIASELGLARATVGQRLCTLRRNGEIPYRDEKKPKITKEAQIKCAYASGMVNKLELSKKYRVKIETIEKIIASITRIGLTYPLKRSKPPRCCDLCKYNDVFKIDKWQKGWCTILQKEVDNEVWTERDYDCPMCTASENVNIVLPTKIVPSGCTYPYAISQNGGKIVMEIKVCPFNAICPHYDSKNYRKKPLECKMYYNKGDKNESRTDK